MVARACHNKYSEEIYQMSNFYSYKRKVFDLVPKNPSNYIDMLFDWSDAQQIVVQFH